MKTFFLSIPLVFLAHTSYGFVSIAQGGGEGRWKVEFKTAAERGKVEPNENRASYQDAQIDIYQLSLAAAAPNPGFGKDHFFRLDAKMFKSGVEEVNGQRFYDADSGQEISLSYGFNFVHEPSYLFGFALSASPVTQFNKSKFSVPRVDVWSIGFNSAFEISTNWFAENSLRYGAGIPGHQNSYMAFTNLFGYRLNGLVGFPFAVKWGPYAELDISDRFDSQYDAAFSVAGRPDRIRSMKIATAIFLDVGLSKDYFASLGYIVKHGGYDAVATNSAVLSVGILF